MGGSTGGFGGGFAQPMTGQQYNQRLMQGQTNDLIRASQSGLFGSGPSDAQWNDVVTQAGLAAGRPLPGSAQFYQPVYQPQYQNYNMGNPMSVSQYGQDFGGFNPYVMQMQTPFNPYTNSFGGGFDNMGMGGGFMPQQQFQPQMNMGAQTPFSSGVSQSRQPIVSRSAQVRGTPNVMMRRAEGGIASLVDDE